MKSKLTKCISLFLVLMVFALMAMGSGSSSSSDSGGSSSSNTPSTPTTTPSTKEPSFEITDTICSITDSSIGSGKQFNVIIEVKNTGDIPIYLDKCVLDFEDDSGHLLQTYDFMSKIPDIVQPGEKGYFYTNGSSSFDDGVSFEKGCNLVPKVSIEKAKGEVVRHEVFDTSIYDSYPAVGIKGRIKNETNKDVSYIYVTTVFYDSNGKVLGISGTSVTDVKANENTSFDDSGIFMSEFSVKDVADYIVYADEMYLQF